MAGNNVMLDFDEWDQHAQWWDPRGPAGAGTVSVSIPTRRQAWDDASATSVWEVRASPHRRRCRRGPKRVSLWGSIARVWPAISGLASPPTSRPKTPASKCCRRNQGAARWRIQYGSIPSPCGRRQRRPMPRAGRRRRARLRCSRAPRTWCRWQRAHVSPRRWTLARKYTAMANAMARQFGVKLDASAAAYDDQEAMSAGMLGSAGLGGAAAAVPAGRAVPAGHVVPADLVSGGMGGSLPAGEVPTSPRDMARLIETGRGGRGQEDVAGRGIKPALRGQAAQRRCRSTGRGDQHNRRWLAVAQSADAATTRMRALQTWYQGHARYVRGLAEQARLMCRISQSPDRRPAVSPGA